ncbi:MAG: hypothetical protein ACJ768_16730 [Gaiellaceae bacterium]
MPSGKKSKAARSAARAGNPPPVRSKGGAPTTGWLGGRLFWFGAGGVVIVTAVIVLAVSLSSGGGGSKPVYVDFGAVAGLQNGPPPWNNGDGSLQTNLTTVHLDPLAQEALAFHIHQHLDVYVNGKHVAVPPLIGIDDNTFVTEMHTHDTSGVLHIESAKNRPYTLGQFFGEWAVRLTGSCLGRYCGSLHWWLDGVRQTGNPAQLVLKAHQEIVIAAGKAPAHVPSSYKWPAGE